MNSLPVCPFSSGWLEIGPQAPLAMDRLVHIHVLYFGQLLLKQTSLWTFRQRVFLIIKFQLTPRGGVQLVFWHIFKKCSHPQGRKNILIYILGVSRYNVVSSPASSVEFPKVREEEVQSNSSHQLNLWNHRPVVS